MIEDLEKELKDVKLVEVDKKEQRKKELIEKTIKFMNEIRKKYSEMVKSVLIFGSVARGDLKPTSDADVLIILDDTIRKAGFDIEKVREDILLTASFYKDLHIQISHLTEFWEWLRLGSPEIVNYLRYGLIIYDTGFAKPIQRMLEMGLIPPSEETIRIKIKSSIARLERIKEALKGIIFDLRYCGSDIIQAAIMHIYKIQPDPKDISNFIKKMVEEGKIEEEWLKKWEELNKMWKDIDHKIVNDVDGYYLQKALTLSSEIVDRFKQFLPKELTED
ncbi:MAG: nucleotidyltransferase domain-containing protein [Candidatus Aenigmatarchaeota archaeon]